MSDLNTNQIAQRAYALFREKDVKAPEWESLPNAHKWEDLTRSFLHNPRALPAHFGEECVVAAIKEARQALEAKLSPQLTTAISADVKPSAKKLKK